ncbi:glycosyltransferase [Lysobacter sp. BMK333-48F3]|uniref:glycosyltransferase n=1 Tax=Lysobacter sp. BMK333-48F3 TaxID=2867962 RepID=UPI001C8CBD13|nr:glycosyltransferase [Lysobacter sp. BMK333-48F3]MBX9400586.1 glycosyltransferase [Lysobacter sp. BMK333-48F3]
MSTRAPIAIFTIGTQGDIRPLVALGRGLRSAGYPVRIVTSDNFAELVRGAGLEHYPLTSDFHAMLHADRSIADRGLDMREMARVFRRQYAQWARSWVAEGRAAIEGAGLLIGVGNSTLLAKSLAEAHGIPFAAAQLQPLTPSRLVPPVVLAGKKRNLPPLLNVASYHLLRHLVWHVMKPALNDIVRPQLGLKKYPWYGPYYRNADTRVVYGFSRHVSPRPADWPQNVQIAGYWFLDDAGWQPSPELQAFLAAGPKPVYIGFGSMVSSDATQFTQTVVDSVRKSGRRAVLATGWGGLDHPDGALDEQIFFIRQAPHDRLFPLMSAAVHHGGAGTTAAAARAGIPSIIVPFYGDQPFWAHSLNALGAGPAALDRNRLDADILADALEQAHDVPMQQAAAALGERIRAEDGVAEAIRHLRSWGLLEPAVEERGKASLQWLGNTA